MDKGRGVGSIDVHARVSHDSTQGTLSQQLPSQQGQEQSKVCPRMGVNPTGEHEATGHISGEGER